MKLYRTTQGVVVEKNEAFYNLGALDWDEILCDDDVIGRLRNGSGEVPVSPPDSSCLLAPVGNQEVWAAGVTYYRSRNARIEESHVNSGGNFYDYVYTAHRPELFFKAVGWRVVGPGGAVRIRSDSSWSVPEPELTLVVNPKGTIIGYTVGNDMSSRDIEGDNPLYLPQAKIYDGSCALGPCILLSSDPFPRSATISLTIEREGKCVISDATTLAQLKRDPKDLVEFLYRETSFPQGGFLMTGTGIVPASAFSLTSRDVIHISIDGIGVLSNFVE